MLNLRNSTLALLLLVAVPQAAVSQTGNQQTGATADAASKSAKLAEANALSVKIVKLHGQRQFDEALALAEQALKLREEAVGEEHQLVADSLKNVGALYLAKGKADKGRQAYARALSIYDKNAAANNANIVKLLDALGLLERFAFNNFPAAAEHYERSLALKESALGAEHADVLKTLYELAELYELLDQTDEAFALHQRVIRVKEKYEADDPYGLVSALERFICLSERRGLKAETDKARQRVDAIRAKQKQEEVERERAEAKRSITGGEILRGGVINGKAISKPPPVYPEAAKQLRISGVVTIFVTVDEKGFVTDAFPCGHPLLSEAALRAAYGARFSPTLLSGKPVKVTGIITYRFVLQ